MKTSRCLRPTPPAASVETILARTEATVARTSQEGGSAPAVTERGRASRAPFLTCSRYRQVTTENLLCTLRLELHRERNLARSSTQYKSRAPHRALRNLLRDT